MNFKRIIITLLAALLLPGLALAQTTQATFNVAKDFVDDNTASVEVTLDCNTGLPITQSQSISNTQDVTFIVEDFESGAMDCWVTEGETTGYTSDASDCSWEAIDEGAAYECTVTNTPIPVQVTVNKDWVIDGTGGDQIDPYYTLTLVCAGEIEGGQTCGKSDYYDDCSYYYGDSWYKTLYSGTSNGTSDEPYTADVVPDWDGGTDCYVDEYVADSAVEVDAEDCDDWGDINVQLDGAGDNECTVTNTVFFEGIPTLSQYGMAIMALLMLGVGFVGFRRLV